MTTIVGKISVFLLAENRLLREALAKILNKKTDIIVVGSAPLSSGVVLKITASSPQVLLFDPPHNTRGECSIIPPLRKALPDRKSTRLNSSHVKISYAVFCLKKKIKTKRCNNPTSLSL